MKALLLAAGFSSRMGKLKQVMDIAEKPMVYRVAESLLAAEVEVIVVIGYQGKRVKEALHGLPCEFVINEHPANGMFSSVKLGCLAIKAGSACLVTPCDCPGILPTTIQRVKNALERNPTKVIIPTFQGRRGHPTGLPAFLVEHIHSLPLDTPGLNSLWQHTPEMVFHLEVDDPTVLRDFDKPEDIK
jgi:molybdenum cofactor cytidylyltransferase